MAVTNKPGPVSATEPELIPFPSTSVGSIGSIGGTQPLSKPYQHKALGSFGRNFAKRRRRSKTDS